MEVKRGYVKWTDDDGVRHKVPLDEFNAIMELEGKDPIKGVSAPPRGYVERIEEVASDDEVDEDAEEVASDDEVGEDAEKPFIFDR